MNTEVTTFMFFVLSRQAFSRGASNNIAGLQECLVNKGVRDLLKIEYYISINKLNMSDQPNYLYSLFLLKDAELFERFIE